MELVDTEWLEPINAEFHECEYCGAIDHKTADCAYRGKLPCGRKGDVSWHIEDGKTVIDIPQEELDREVSIKPDELLELFQISSHIHEGINDWLNPPCGASPKTGIDICDNLIAQLPKLSSHLTLLRDRIEEIWDRAGFDFKMINRAGATADCKMHGDEIRIKCGELRSLTQMREQISKELNQWVHPESVVPKEGTDTLGYLIGRIDVITQAQRSMTATLEEISERNLGRNLDKPDQTEAVSNGCAELGEQRKQEASGRLQKLAATNYRPHSSSNHWELTYTKGDGTRNTVSLKDSVEQLAKRLMAKEDEHNDHDFAWELVFVKDGDRRVFTAGEVKEYLYKFGPKGNPAKQEKELRAAVEKVIDADEKARAALSEAAERKPMSLARAIMIYLRDRHLSKRSKRTIGWTEEDWESSLSTWAAACVRIYESRLYPVLRLLNLAPKR